VRREAFDDLARGYWRPAYTYVRLKWRKLPEDAQDITQAFLAAAWEKNFFTDYDPARARFRTFLRTCLDRFVMNQERSAGTLKRGGGVETVALDFETAEGELRERELPPSMDADTFFRQETIRDLFARSVDQVRDACGRDGKKTHFRLFERYDLGPETGVSYADLAREYGLSVTQVTNHLALVRRLFRAAVLANLRAMSAHDDEYRSDARELFGIEVE
jgi:DNA-directed RNA polymerase specialized sigma24 family protein